MQKYNKRGIQFLLLQPSTAKYAVKMSLNATPFHTEEDAGRNISPWE